MKFETIPFNLSIPIVFSLHISNTLAICPFIFGNFISRVVIQEPNWLEHEPYHTMLKCGFYD